MRFKDDDFENSGGIPHFSVKAPSMPKAKDLKVLTFAVIDSPVSRDIYVMYENPNNKNLASVCVLKTNGKDIVHGENFYTAEPSLSYNYIEHQITDIFKAKAARDFNKQLVHDSVFIGPVVRNGDIEFNMSPFKNKKFKSSSSISSKKFEQPEDIIPRDNYIAKEGDTLESIAKSNFLTVEQLMMLNNMTEVPRSLENMSFKVEVTNFDFKINFYDPKNLFSENEKNETKNDIYRDEDDVYSPQRVDERLGGGNYEPMGYEHDGNDAYSPDKVDARLGGGNYDPTDDVTAGQAYENLQIRPDAISRFWEKVGKGLKKVVTLPRDKVVSAYKGYVEKKEKAVVRETWYDETYANSISSEMYGEDPSKLTKKGYKK